MPPWEVKLFAIKSRRPRWQILPGMPRNNAELVSPKQKWLETEVLHDWRGCLRDADTRSKRQLLQWYLLWTIAHGTCSAHLSWLWSSQALNVVHRPWPSLLENFSIPNMEINPEMIFILILGNSKWGCLLSWVSTSANAFAIGRQIEAFHWSTCVDYAYLDCFLFNCFLDLCNFTLLLWVLDWSFFYYLFQNFLYHHGSR